MQTVTFETAKKLKEAGFPQPAFEFGQFWYTPNGYPCAMSGDGIYSGEARVMLHNGNTMFLKIYAIYFAPSATDILQQLPSHLSLNYDTGEFWCGEEKDWNPAEACAAAWLALKEK